MRHLLTTLLSKTIRLKLRINNQFSSLSCNTLNPISQRESIEFCQSWPDEDFQEMRRTVSDGMIIVNDFVDELEEKCLLAEVDPYLKKMRYEYDHWDNAIHGYRETEKRSWNEQNTSIINRVRKTAFKTDATTLEHVHVLDLAPNGYIKPHVDAIRFCGSVIAGICLLSDAVMRLVHTENKNLALDVLLKRRCLYIIRDAARYDYTHEILSQELSNFKTEKIKRSRRISIICRSLPKPEKQN